MMVKVTEHGTWVSQPCNKKPLDYSSSLSLFHFWCHDIDDDQARLRLSAAAKSKVARIDCQKGSHAVSRTRSHLPISIMPPDRKSATESESASRSDRGRATTHETAINTMMMAMAVTAVTNV